MNITSEFIKNIITLLSGTSVAQAIPILITPILTRIYGPEDFGALAMFTAMSVVLGTVACCRYELAIMDPEDDKDAIDIAVLALLIASVFSLCLFVPVVLFNDNIMLLFKNDDLRYFLYCLPFVVWIIAVFNILNQLNVRKKLYRDLAITSVVKSTVLSFMQVCVGLVKSGAFGLVAGQIMSYIAANSKLLINFKANYRGDDLKIKKSELYLKAAKYNDFPKYSVVAALANTSSTHIVNILISSFYSISTLGLYSLTQRVLGMPLTLISKAVSQVYFQKATRELKEIGNTDEIYKYTVKMLFLVGVPVFLLIYNLAPDIFVIVFGSEWEVAGKYAQILVPLFFIRFIVSPLTLTNAVYKKNKIGMWWQLILMLLHILIFIYSKYFSLDFEDYLRLVTYIISAHYLTLLFVMSKYKA